MPYIIFEFYSVGHVEPLQGFKEGSQTNRPVLKEKAYTDTQTKWVAPLTPITSVAQKLVIPGMCSSQFLHKRL